MKKNKKMMKKKKTEEEELTRGGGFPDNDDIVEEIKLEILSRLPAKALIQFKTTCKQWLSLISHPLFAQLHLTNNNATTSGYLIYARNTRTYQQYILTTARPDGGGPLTHLLTINGVAGMQTKATETVHLHGLVLHTCNVFSYLVNPTTGRYIKLPFPNNVNNNNVETIHTYNFFGFDQSQKQHKILHMRVLRTAAKVLTTEFELFSLSDYSWRKLDNLTLPLVDDTDLSPFYPGMKHSVCVNSVIHVMLPYRFNKVLAFHLSTERFSVIDLPVPLPPHPYTHYYSRTRALRAKFSHPFFTQIDGGLLGVVYDDRLVETNQIHIWILQDHENRVWVRKTITLSADKSWIDLDEPVPLDFSCKDNQFVFSPKRLPKKNNSISVPVFDLKDATFKSLDFFVGDHPFLCSEHAEFVQFKSYVGTISPNHRPNSSSDRQCISPLPWA